MAYNLTRLCFGFHRLLKVRMIVFHCCGCFFLFQSPVCVLSEHPYGCAFTQTEHM